MIENDEDTWDMLLDPETEDDVDVEGDVVEVPAEDEIDPENLAREMFDLSLDMVTSGKYKRKLEAQIIGKEEVEELLKRRKRWSKTSVDLESDDSSHEEIRVENTVVEDNEENEGIDEPEEVNEIISLTKAREESDLTEEHASERKDSRKQRVKLCRRLMAEAKCLHVKNLILQRKIGHISIGRKLLAIRNQLETSEEQPAEKKTPLEVTKKEYHQFLDEYETLKESYLKQKEKLDADIAQRRKRKDILKHSLRVEKEAFKSFWLTEVTKLRSNLTGQMVTVTAAEDLLRALWTKLDLLKREHWLYVMSCYETNALKKSVTRLDVYGEKARICQYEHLEEQCPKLSDRIEERAEAMVLMQERACRDIQGAAHLRDVMHEMEEDIDETLDYLDEVNIKLDAAREEAALLKRKRDRIRRKDKHIDGEIQMLAYPTLLQNFQKVRNSIKKAEGKLNGLKSIDRQLEKCIGAAVKASHPKLTDLLRKKRSRSVAGRDYLKEDVDFVALLMDIFNT